MEVATVQRKTITSKAPTPPAVLARKCVTCHGRYDVSKPSDMLYTGVGRQQCGSCHPPDSEPGQVAQSLYDDISAAAHAYEEAESSIRSARKAGMLVAPRTTTIKVMSSNWGAPPINS